MQSSIDHVAISVEAEQPDLTPVAAPDGTVTIMFSDIEDSTMLTERFGDDRWLALLRHDGIIRRQLGAHGGFEVKSQGDGFMLAFGSARAAIQCAIAIELADTARRTRTCRCACGSGCTPARCSANGPTSSGRNLILAARIAAQARGNEILARRCCVTWSTACRYSASATSVILSCRGWPVCTGF